MAKSTTKYAVAADASGIVTQDGRSYGPGDVIESDLSEQQIKTGLSAGNLVEAPEGAGDEDEAAGPTFGLPNTAVGAQAFLTDDDVDTSITTGEPGVVIAGPDTEADETEADDLPSASDYAAADLLTDDQRRDAFDAALDAEPGE